MSRASTALSAAVLLAMPVTAALAIHFFDAPQVPKRPFTFAAPPLGPDDRARIDRATRDEIVRWTRERDEVLVETIDPGELAEHARRLHQDDLDQKHASVDQIFLVGEAIFDRRFTTSEGLGVGSAKHSRVQRAALLGGPDAVSCKECHGRGGDDGHGELHQRAWLDGDGRHLVSAKPRVVPHVAGGGIVQALAAEMSAELKRSVDEARASMASRKIDATVPLIAKGVRFGDVTVKTDGTVDTSRVVGVDADLVVRPFGWKGAHATLRSFVRGAMPQHLGLEPLPLIDGAKAFPQIERESHLYDSDGDGIAGEITEGQISALAIYLALVDVPVILPPRDPEAYAAWSRGATQLRALGCTSCHAEQLTLASTKWIERAPGREGGFEIDLSADNQVPPRIEPSDYGSKGVAVRLFSDLRRHDMGAGLAERREGGASETEFVTRPLWGLGDRGAYYLHDGRARSLRQAIVLHGGEATSAANAYAALDPIAARDLDVFLLSLRRMPQGRIAP